MTQKILKINFDTSEIDSKYRYDLWRESISTIFEFDSKTEIDEKSFCAQLETIHFGSILLNTTETQKQYFKRSQKLIAQDDMDHCWLQIITSGSSKIELNNKKCDIQLRIGDIVFIDFCQSFSVLTTNFSDINLIIPRKIIQQYLPNFAKYHGTILPRESIFAQILSSNISMLKNISLNTSVNESTILAESIAQLAGLYFRKQPISTDKDSEVHMIATKEAIQCYIVNNLNNPELTPDHIAKKFKMSRAYLYKMFSEVGVVNYIYEQRLKKAYRALNRIDDKRRISEIAFSFGFESESHFSSRFRKFFSLSPSEARNNAIELWTKEMKNLGQDKNTLSDFHFNFWVRNL